MLQAAAGPTPEPLFGDPSLIFDRRYTEAAPAAHKAAGGKAWDTIKPLAPHFKRLERVLLIDDDAFKVSLSLGPTNIIQADGNSDFHKWYTPWPGGSGRGVPL